MHNPMGITCPKEDANIPLYMLGIIVYADNSSPTQKKLEDSPWIVLTYHHGWYPHSVSSPKGSHSKEEEYLFSGSVPISVDALRSKVHDTNIDPGIRNTMHDPSFIATPLVSQVRIADAKVTDATRINDLYEDVFEGRRQDVPSHSNFTSKERHSDVNPSDISERWQIGLGAATKTLKATTQMTLQSAIMPISRRYRADRMFEQPHIKGMIFTDTMAGRYKFLNINCYAQVFANYYFFDAAYPMEKKSLAGQGLREFIRNFGVMERLVYD